MILALDSVSDCSVSFEIRKLVQELAAEHTIILSSHILPEITQICKRVIIINEGEIAAVDSLGGLTASLRKSERFSLTLRNSDGNEVEKLKNSYFNF